MLISILKNRIEALLIVNLNKLIVLIIKDKIFLFVLVHFVYTQQQMIWGMDIK